MEYLVILYHTIRENRHAPEQTSTRVTSKEGCKSERKTKKRPLKMHNCTKHLSKEYILVPTPPPLLTPSVPLPHASPPRKMYAKALPPP